MSTFALAFSLALPLMPDPHPPRDVLLSFMSHEEAVARFRAAADYRYAWSGVPDAPPGDPYPSRYAGRCRADRDRAERLYDLYDRLTDCWTFGWRNEAALRRGLEAVRRRVGIARWWRRELPDVPRMDDDALAFFS